MHINTKTLSCIWGAHIQCEFCGNLKDHKSQQICYQSYPYCNFLNTTAGCLCFNDKRRLDIYNTQNKENQFGAFSQCFICKTQNSHFMINHKHIIKNILCIYLHLCRLVKYKHIFLLQHQVIYYLCIYYRLSIMICPG